MAITEHGLAAEAVARPQRWRRGDAPTVALHWLVALLLLVSLATGFRVAADALEAGWWRGVAARIAPQGAVLLWHIASACALLAAAAGYVTFLVRARQVGRVRLDARRRAYLRSPDARRRWKSVNVLIYWLAFGLVFAAGATGLLMYSDLVNRAEWRLSHLHRWIAWSLAGYVVLHVSAQLALDGWRALYAILVPRRSFGVAAAAAGAALALAAVGVLTIDWLTVRTLAVSKVQDLPRLDGAFDDPAWQDARAVTIETAGGANLVSGGSTVTVRAVHDDTDAYFLFEWRDPTRSFTHHPLQKTAAGWRMLQNGFFRADETDFYEDKFAVMLSNAGRFAALRATHLGPRPVETLPGASGQRGLHYTDDWSVLDVWHWMAVRTDPLGQAEDDYFGPLRLPSELAARPLRRRIRARSRRRRRFPAELEGSARRSDLQAHRRRGRPALPAGRSFGTRPLREGRCRSRVERRGPVVAACGGGATLLVRARRDLSRRLDRSECHGQAADRGRPRRRCRRGQVERRSVAPGDEAGARHRLDVRCRARRRHLPVGCGVRPHPDPSQLAHAPAPTPDGVTPIGPRAFVDGPWCG